MCNSKDFELISTQTDLIHRSTNKFQCSKAINGLHFTNPRPKIDDIGKFYISEYKFTRKFQNLDSLETYSKIVKLKIIYVSLFFS